MAAYLKSVAVFTQLMECAYYSLMTLRIYGGDAHFRALQTCLREQPLQATDIWTACRVRFHEQLDLTTTPAPWAAGGGGEAVDVGLKQLLASASRLGLGVSLCDA